MIVLVLEVFYINPFAEDVLVVCRSELGLYVTCKIPKIAQEKNRHGVDLDTMFIVFCWVTFLPVADC